MSIVKKASHAETIAQLDQWTREGRRFSVLKELERILRSRPEGALAPQYARIANRNHAYLLALRILHPVIRDDQEKVSRASPEALTTYATSLMWVGALEEAQSFLDRVRGHSESFLTQAFLHFAQWDYESAIPVLKRYIRSSKTPEYQKLVGNVNLLAALIATGETSAARELMNGVRDKLKSQSSKILYGNCLELQAQIELFEGKLDDARAALAESERALSEQPGRYLLYVRKWKAVLDLMVDPRSGSARDALLSVRREAQELQNWETIRDCDFHLARLTGDKELLDRVILGTPYRAYRERVERNFGVNASGARELRFCPGDGSKAPNEIALNVEKIQWRDFFNPTSWPLIQLLVRDLYRPPRVGVVFSAVYPGERFNPFTSPQRVRNTIFRFNEWAEARGVQFRIRVRRGDYFLEGPAGMGVSRPASLRVREGWEAALKLFREAKPGRSFSAAELAEFLEVSPRTALSYLTEALAKKRIERFGRGKNSRYIFASPRRTARQKARARKLADAA